MADRLLIIDTLLRGATIGAEALIAFALLLPWPPTWRRGLGAAFIASAGCYIANSSAAVIDSIGLLKIPVQVLSIISPVIFWQFSLSLFDDRFRMRPLTLLPFLFVAPLLIFHFGGVEGAVWTAALIIARIVMIFSFGHAMYTALRFLNDDLIEGRRRFRILFAAAVGVTGLIINYTETFGPGAAPPPSLLLFQAAAILLLTLVFGAWLLGTRAEVLDGRKLAPSVDAPAAPGLKAADRPAYDRLMKLMEEGAWREDGLSVAALASKVGVPEHKLRALINGELGYRNFSAFLNAHRLKEAQRLLSDPEQARRQILQIALDVGYGSIAPFNRAFKEATGATPSDFRKKALGGG